MIVTEPAPGRGPSSWGDDADAIRGILAHYPAAVVAICAAIDGQPIGMLATSVAVGISFEPPVISFAAQRESRTWRLLRSRPTLGISLLGAEQAGGARQLASRSGDRFAGFSPGVGDRGEVLLAGSALFMTATVLSELPVGDHFLVTLVVDSVSADPEIEPLLYHRSEFRSIVGGRR
jgi:flavin reductase (DIM6/NTAB) family NADH-FMN oxidoreductase RutF